MGAFSNMDYELQNSEAAVSDAFTEDDAKLLEEILVKDAVHAGLLEQQRTIHQKYLFLRLLVTIFCTEQ